jgi:hypothetical protein
VAEVRLLYDLGYVINGVGNLSEEKSHKVFFNFPPDYELREDIGNRT